MPRNDKQPFAYDYSSDLSAGRTDVQEPCQFFVDGLFAGCNILDVGAGLGQSKARLRHNRVTTYDIDPRLKPFVDIAGGEMPRDKFDVVTAFDVIEHVEDDIGLLRSIAERARWAVALSTPNWHFSQCASAHHVREYTGAELHELALQVWPADALRLFAHYKDRWGSWFDPVPADAWDRHIGSKHMLLVLHDDRDRMRIDGFFAGRWGTASQPSTRWVPRLADGDEIPVPLAMVRGDK